MASSDVSWAWPSSGTGRFALGMRVLIDGCVYVARLHNTNHGKRQQCVIQSIRGSSNASEKMGCLGDLRSGGSHLGLKAGEAAARRRVAVKTYNTEEIAISELFLSRRSVCCVRATRRLAPVTRIGPATGHRR